MSAPTLADALARGRRNNLDLVRLAAAFAVVVSHAFPLALGPGAPEPLAAATGLSLGGWAVIVFFLVSGVLVTRSAERHGDDLAGFAIARALRILPGLLGVLLAVAAAALLLTPTTPADAIAYVVRGATLVSIEHTLPGAFADNPYPGAVNGPLWTLFWEAAAYALVGAAALLLLVRRRRGTGAALALAGAGGIAVLAVSLMEPRAVAARLEAGGLLLAAFAVGAAAALSARRVRLEPRITAALWCAVAAAALVDGRAATALGVLALGHTVLLAAWRTPAVRLPLDVSYGVYLYGWPVAQALVVLAGGTLSPLALALLSSAAVLPAAVASAVLVERPALALARLRQARPARTAAA